MKIGTILINFICSNTAQLRQKAHKSATILTKVEFPCFNSVLEDGIRTEKVGNKGAASKKTPQACGEGSHYLHYFADTQSNCIHFFFLLNLVQILDKERSLMPS